MSPAASRRRAERRGAWGEIAAAILLTLKGYQVVARRRRTPFGEIDLIARRGGILAFVEVKTLGSAAARADPVRPRQMARTARAASAFRGQRPDLAGLDMRYDWVIVAPWRWPAHHADAWRPDSPDLAHLN